MKIAILFLITLCCICSFAQDTIRFKDNSTDIGKILEIGLEEIKYTSQNNDKGVVFVRYKTEVDYIRFENGELQKFTEKYAVKTTTTTASIPYQKIIRKKKALYYNGARIGEHELLNIISNHPIVEKREQLKKEYSRMIGYRRQQYWFGTAGPITSGIILIGGVFLTYLSWDERFFIGGAAVAGAVLVPTVAMSIFSKTKRKKQFLKIAELYNTP